MNTDTNVRGALINAANDFLTVGDPVLSPSVIAWENRNLKVFQNVGMWASVFYRPNTPEARTIGRGGIDEQTGFLQIDFNAPQNKGESELNKWENKGREYFSAGNRFSLESTSVLVISVGMTQGRRVENNFRKSLEIAFKAQLKRQPNI